MPITFFPDPTYLTYDDVNSPGELDLLKKLQSPEYDILTDSKHKILKRSMIEGDSLDEFVPEIIKYILNGFYVVLIEKNQAIKKFNEWKEKKKNENI